MIRTGETQSFITERSSVSYSLSIHILNPSLPFFSLTHIALKYKGVKKRGKISSKLKHCSTERKAEREMFFICCIRLFYRG